MLQTQKQNIVIAQQLYGDTEWSAGTHHSGIRDNKTVFWRFEIFMTSHIGCDKVRAKYEMRSIEPLFIPDTIGLPTCILLWILVSV